MARCARCAWVLAEHLLRPSATWRKVLPEAEAKVQHCQFVRKGGACMLQCKGSSAVLSPNNPSQACNQHSNSCKCWPEEEEDTIDLDEDDDGSIIERKIAT